MRCYVAGVQHECSSFSPIPTNLASFYTVRWGVNRPAAVRGMGYGEACDLAVELGHDVVAGPFSMAQPSLPATTEAWHTIRDGILDELRAAVAAGPVDVVFLCLHGAQMSDTEDDCEGELLAAAREIVGTQAAIGTLLDLHANVTARMLDAADLVVSCREYPHVDYAQRVAEMLPVLARIARREVAPTTAALRVNAPGAYPTPDEPTRSLVRRITELQAQPGVLMVSVNHGFEGSDHPDMGASIVVTTDGDPQRAAALAHEIAGSFLEMVGSQSWFGPGVVESVDAALSFDGGPVVLAERADNPGGGAAGDSTFVLAELIRRDARNVALALLWDPVAVDLCHAAGLGARLPLRIGGKCSPMSGDPLDVQAHVISLRDDARQALYGQGEPADRLGRSAAIRIGGPDGIEIVLNSIRQQTFSRHCFTEHGIDPTTKHVLVVKSTQHFMMDFGTFAAHVVRCDGPGTLTQDLASLPYRRVQRPMLGLDPLDTIGVQPLFGSSIDA